MTPTTPSGDKDGAAADHLPTEGRSWRAWCLLGVLLLFYTCAVMDRAVISMLVDPIRQDLGISDTQVALLMGVAFSVVYAGAALPMGYLADKLPRKWILYIAVTFWSFAEAACGVAGGFGAIFLARMGVGLGESPLNSSSHSLIADTFPKRRLATAMSIYSMAAGIGTGLAMVISGWIINALMGHDTITIPVFGAVKPWQFAFIITGLPGMLLALLILPFREPRRLKHKASGGEGAWGDLGRFLLKNWRVSLCLIVAFGGMNIVNGALIKWQPAYMGRYFHLNPKEYGTALGIIYAVAGVSGMMASGWLVDRWFAKGNKTAHIDFYILALLITTPIVIYGLLSPSLTTYLICIVVAKGVTLTFLGYYSALVQMISPPRLRGRMSAIFVLMVVALLGSSLGPLIPALISDHVLHDEIRLGRALAATLGIFAPLAVLAMVWGRPAIRKAVTDAEAWA